MYTCNVGHKILFEGKGRTHLKRNTELDKLYQEELPQYYNGIITLNSKYEDPILDDFYLTYQAMLLTKDLIHISPVFPLTCFLLFQD